MTREEAIERLKDILAEATANEDAVCYVTSDDADALDVAIKALEQMPRKDEVILTKEEYGKLVSSEFDNGYAKGYEEAVANSNLEYRDILNKIEDLLNSSNRGTCDYFIVDKIEEIIKVEREELREMEDDLCR